MKTGTSVVSSQRVTNIGTDGGVCKVLGVGVVWGVEDSKSLTFCSVVSKRIKILGTR